MAILSNLLRGAGVSPLTTQAFCRAFDGTVRDFAYLSLAEFDALVGGLRVAVIPSEGGAEADPAQAGEAGRIPFRDRTRLRQARDRAKTLVGLQRVDAPSGEEAEDPPEPGRAFGKKIKLASVVSPATETDRTPLSASSLHNLLARYQQDRGSPPGEESEPTLEQISAIEQLVRSNAPPYVDFAFFGPHDRRFLGRLTYVDTIFQISPGTWVRRKLPGPDSYEAWERSWGVFECASIILKIISPERLYAYHTHIKKLVTLCGPGAWPVIYQADVQMRSERLEHLRRQARTYKEPLLSRDTPWDYIFHLAVEDHLFWSREVQEKAAILLSSATPSRKVAGGAALSEGVWAEPHQPEDRDKEEVTSHSHPTGSDRPGRHTRNKGRKSAPGPANMLPLTAADRANQFCRLFNEVKCQAPCPYGRRHACTTCGGNHPAAFCNGRDRERKWRAPPV